MRKKTIVTTLIVGAVLFGSFAFSPIASPVTQESTLQILPKDISDDELMQVMNSFETALGMNCGDCHTHSTVDPNKMDWSANTKHKETTLAMMRMVQETNEKYFGVKGDFKDNYLRSQFEVTCATCHNGHEEPNNLVTIPVPDPREK